jgi:flagellar basal body-associated protein FliL
MSTTATELKDVTISSNPKTNPPKKSNTSLVVALIILGLILASALGAGYYFWQQNEEIQFEIYNEQKKTKAIEEIKKQLDEELESTRTELNSYMNRTTKLDDLLALAQKKINVKQWQINKLAKDKADIAAFEQQLVEVNDMNEGFRVQIAALTEQVDSLRTENDGLKQTIATLEEEKTALTDKINSGSALQAHSIKAESMKHKKGETYIFTNRAKNTDRVAISFELPENALAPKGAKDIHLLIISPNGSVLSDAATDQPIFTIIPGNQESAFTRHKSIDYTGEKQKIFFNWDKSKGYLKGSYKLEIYCDGLFIGKTEFALR